jgi:serine/threonine protein phosphatase PrpC
VIQAEAGMSGLIASDGLWEVIDTEEVCRILTNLRGMGKGAGDAAKTICSMAIERGSSDNVSVVILYLE